MDHRRKQRACHIRPRRSVRRTRLPFSSRSRDAHHDVHRRTRAHEVLARHGIVCHEAHRKRQRARRVHPLGPDVRVERLARWRAARDLAAVLVATVARHHPTAPRPLHLVFAGTRSEPLVTREARGHGFRCHTTMYIFARGGCGRVMLTRARPNARPRRFPPLAVAPGACPG